MIHFVLECWVLGHQFVGEFFGTYRLGVVGGKWGCGLAEAASDWFEVVVYWRVLVEDCLTGADQRVVLQPGNIRIGEWRIVESRVDDTPSLLHLGTRCHVPNEANWIWIFVLVRLHTWFYYRLILWYLYIFIFIINVLCSCYAPSHLIFEFNHITVECKRRHFWGFGIMY